MPSGGYRGGLWDDTADVEYTFYGLGARRPVCQESLARIIHYRVTENTERNENLTLCVLCDSLW